MAGSLAPQKLGDADWYYEEKSHLLLVHEVRSSTGNYICTEQVKIPWKKIEASLKRVRARKRRAAKQ